MAHIDVDDAKAWTEDTKVGVEFDELDDELEAQVSEIVISRLSSRFTTSAWVGESTTPSLIKTLIAMYYVSFVYDKVYSTDDDLSAYAVLLRQQADLNIAALLAGNIDLPEEPTNTGFGSPEFYPNDLSSSQDPTYEDSSLGPAAFSMGTVF
jgi:hypothetical protein